MKMKLIILRRIIVFYIVWPLAFLLGCLRKVDPKLVVFAYNQHYAKLPDNLEPVKNYFEQQGYKCMIYANPQTKLERLLGDIRFQFIYARSAVIFISDNFDQLYAHKPRKGTRVVQLWHACGAFKKWGYSTLDSDWGDNRKMWKLFPKHTSYTDIMVSSPEVIPYYAEAFNNPEDIIRALGTPRTDVFFDKSFVESGKRRLVEAIPEIGDRKVILYAPTFRGSSPSTAYNDKMIDYGKFKAALGDEYALVLKYHPFTYSKMKLTEEEQENFGDFVFICPPEIGIDCAMCAADILVSDYSSLIFEYSLLNRPMIFFAYDLEEYEHSRDYYFPYRDFVPGSIVKNDDELLECITNGTDTQKVKAFKDKFMSACDGNSTQRISEYIIKSLKFN